MVSSLFEHTTSADNLTWHSGKSSVLSKEGKSPGSAAFGIENWWLKVYGVDGILSDEWISYIESTPLPPEYSKFTKELIMPSKEHQFAVGTKEGLDLAIVPTPDNCILSSQT